MLHGVGKALWKEEQLCNLALDGTSRDPPLLMFGEKLGFLSKCFGFSVFPRVVEGSARDG